MWLSRRVLFAEHLYSTVSRVLLSARVAHAKRHHRFTGLMYYNARYDDPVIGTFISPAAPVASSV